MKAKKFIVAVVCTLLLLNAFAGCDCAWKPVDSSSDDTGSSSVQETTYSVVINEETFTLYETKSMQLTATAEPEDEEITWSSDDPAVATVSADGLVTAEGAGKTYIRASIREGEYDAAVEVTVVAPVINAAMASGFDLTDLYRDNAEISTGSNAFAAFNGAADKYYVATATVKVTEPDGGDTWSRVGVSHYDPATNSYYGLQLSPGPNFNARKTVTMVIKDGGVQWGTVTDRSQVWNQHDLGGIDFDAVTLTAVRCDNEYYAYVNGNLYYKDDGMEGFDEVDTHPVLNAGSCKATFSAMSVLYGQEAAEEYLAAAEKPMFYGSYADTIIGEDGSIEFTGAAAGTCNTNAKDHGAKSIGTMAALQANKESTVEFDLYVGAFGGRDAMPALAVTINRYDGACAESRSLVIGQYKAGWTGWNGNGNLNEGIGDGGRNYMLAGEETRLEEGQTYHVTFTRLMDGGQDTKLKITDKDGNVLLEYAHGWNDGYTGRVLVSFLCRDLDCKITNLVIA